MQKKGPNAPTVTQVFRKTPSEIGESDMVGRVVLFPFGVRSSHALGLILLRRCETDDELVDRR